VETISDRRTSGAGALRIVAIAFLATAAPAFGQPAANAGYDLDSTTEMRGEIAQFGAVPGGDALAQVMAPDGNSELQRRTVMLGKAAGMRTAGLMPLALAPGVQVVISGNPSRPVSIAFLRKKLTADGGFAWTRPPPAP
jgi:hypothetical protein